MTESVGGAGGQRPSPDEAAAEMLPTPAELAVELSDLNDRLDAFDSDDSAVLWVAVPAAVALGWGMWIGFRLLGVGLFLLWMAVTIVFFAAALLVSQAWKGRERNALLEERARVMALLAAHADDTPEQPQ